MFIGEHVDGTIAKIESRDVIFLENEFICISEVNKDIHLYDLNDPKINDILIYKLRETYIYLGILILVGINHKMSLLHSTTQFVKVIVHLSHVIVLRFRGRHL